MAWHLGQDVDVEVLKQRLLGDGCRGIARVMTSIEHQRNGSGLPAKECGYSCCCCHHRRVAVEVAVYVLQNVRNSWILHVELERETWAPLAVVALRLRERTLAPERKNSSHTAKPMPDEPPRTICRDTHWLNVQWSSKNWMQVAVCKRKKLTAFVTL
jgi:hypothetical protein